MLKSAHIRREPGRPTLSDGELMGCRDRLVWRLSVSWGDIGWQLPKASNSEELYEALAPLRGQTGEEVVAIFLHRTTESTDGNELRRLRKELSNAVDRMQLSYEQQVADERLFSAAETAIQMNQIKEGEEVKFDPRLSEEHRNVMLTELEKRRGKFQSAKSVYLETLNFERTRREKLRDKEAAFAQAELLDYIAKGQYARNPLSLANAMAGLPFLGWPQSYARTSKIDCSGWPSLWYSEFETIQDIWNLRTSVSQLSIVELFRREVQKLPKKTLVYYQPEKRKIWMPNQLRSRLADNFMLLRLAIEETLQTKMHPGRVPFAITSRFEKHIEKSRTAADDLLIAHERIE